MKWVALDQKHHAALFQIMMAENLFERVCGLIGRKKLADNQALLLSPCNSVHTFGLRFPLDIVFLNSRNVILEIHSDVSPFRMRACWHACKVLELQAGQAIVQAWAPGLRLYFSDDI